MTGIDELMLWRPDTVKVILEVKKMRQEGLPAYFSIDTGATVYINSRLEDVSEVRGRVEALGIETIECSVGGESKLVRDELF
jgi:phosphomevalonate decarboxylase